MLKTRGFVVAATVVLLAGSASVAWLKTNHRQAPSAVQGTRVVDSSADLRVRLAASQASEAVLAQLDAARWSAGDAAAIAHAFEIALPVCAGVGTSDYLDFIDSVGLPGDIARTRLRFEAKSSSTRWNQLVQDGLVPPLPKRGFSADEMHRLLVDVGPLLHDARVSTIDPNSVRIRETTNVELGEGERYTMTSALSAEWKTESGVSRGVSIETNAVLNDGRAVRIHLLIAQTRGREGVVWAPAACALISKDGGRLPFVTY
jgi:hypothetical protein